MSKKSNVHPDHYKTAGRERQGDDIVQEIHKQNYTTAKATRQRANQNPPNSPKEAKPAGKKSAEEKRD